MSGVRNYIGKFSKGNIRQAQSCYEIKVFNHDIVQLIPITYFQNLDLMDLISAFSTFLFIILAFKFIRQITQVRLYI